MKIYIFYENATLRRLKNMQIQRYNNSLEIAAKKINLNSKLRKEFIFVLGTLFYINDTVNAYAVDPLSKVDKAGNTILGIVRRIGYWCCIIGCVIDVIKALMQGDTKSIAKIMMKYALAFGALYIFPWILDLIKGIFQ